MTTFYGSPVWGCVGVVVALVVGLGVGLHAHKDLERRIASILKRHDDLMARTEWLMLGLERAGFMKWTKDADGKINGSLVEIRANLVSMTSMTARLTATTDPSTPEDAQSQ